MKLGPIPRTHMNTAKVHNLPIDDVKHEEGSSRYGLELLTIGQSIKVYFTDRIKLHSATKRHGERYKKTFVFDKLDKGFRIWRTA